MSITRKTQPNGVTFCSKCKNERYKIRYHNNKEKYRALQRRSKLKRAYGVTPEFIDGKPCGICGTTSFGKRRGHVDHDHESGLVRGILCHACNTGIGLLGPNLVKAIEYLNKHSLKTGNN